MKENINKKGCLKLGRCETGEKSVGGDRQMNGMVGGCSGELRSVGDD